MPWEVRKSGPQFCVHKKDDGSKVACHDTEEEAKSHMAALYANEKSVDDATLAFNGGEVKALGDGKIGGYLVRFSGADDPDLQGDYFTQETDFYIEHGDKRTILYRHGVHPLLKSQKLGKATLSVDDVGVFVEGELDIRDKYVRAIYTLAEKGKLGWSSGSMTHLVVREPNGKSFEMKAWPIGEASLTPTPVEGRTSAFPLKEIVIPAEEVDFDAIVKSLDEPEPDEEELSIDGIPSAVKAFCEAVSPVSTKDGKERSEAAVDATKEFITIGKVLGEGFHSYTSRLVRRTENRFLKDGREIHPETVSQVNVLLEQIGRMEPAFTSVKESLLGLKNIADMSVAEQRALDERARLALMNFCRISGTLPEE